MQYIRQCLFAAVGCVIVLIPTCQFIELFFGGNKTTLTYKSFSPILDLFGLLWLAYIACTIIVVVTCMLEIFWYIHRWLINA